MQIYSCTNNYFILFIYRRRLPKQNDSQVNTQQELDPEKLSEEAFRLFRTVQNLLHTQEPLLHSIVPPEVFDRKNTTRESHCSVRSGTDDSIHSSLSGSKNVIIDEGITERASPILPTSDLPETCIRSSSTKTSVAANRIKEGHQIHLIDDESGFSSMNSFQEIGLPLVNSTMIRSPVSSAASTSSESTEMDNITTIEKKDEKTIITVAGSAQRDKIGLPIISHRRWDSAPVASSRLQLTNESTSQVLWV